MQIQEIKFGDIAVAETNARSKKAVNGVDTLAASILGLGLLCPLIGVKSGKGADIIAGQRRLAAIDKIRKKDPSAFKTVPVYLIEGLTAAQAIEMSLHENLERELLGPIDEADAFAKMQKEGAPIADIAANFGRKEQFVHQRLKIAALPAWAKRGITDGDISLGVAQVMTSAAKAMLTELGKEFKSGANPYVFNNASSMINRLSQSSRIQQGVGLFDVEGSGLTVIRNLFDEEFDGTILEVDKFWEMQNAAIQEKKEEFEAEGHEVHIFAKEDHFPSYKYDQSKAKKHTVVIEADYDGSVTVTKSLKLKPGIDKTTNNTASNEADIEIETKDDLSKKLMLEMNEIRSMTVAHALAIGAGRGYVMQCANIQMMFGSHFASNGGAGQPHNWNEDLAAEHESFSDLEDAAEAICKILNIKVADGEWAINVIAHPRLGHCNYGEVIYAVMTMDDDVALKLQGLLVAAHALLVKDTWAEEDSYNIVEMVGAFLEAEGADGFSGNADWELNERVIGGIRNRDTLEALLNMRGGQANLAFDKNTKVGDLKKMLADYMASNNGRKAPWLPWLDFPAKELG